MTRPPPLRLCADARAGVLTAPITIPNKPGLYFNVPEAEYRAWPYLSQSVLKYGGKQGSMLHLKAAMVAGERAPTEAMRLGTALHVAFLEPELMPSKVVKWEGGTRRGAKWEEFKAEHAGKVILTAKSHEKLVGMVRALRANPCVREFSSRIQGVEVSGLAEINGVLVKGRCDVLTDGPIIDLKKCQSTDERAFTRDIFKFQYDVQDFVYSRIFGRDEIKFIAVEEKNPHDIARVSLTPAVRKYAMEEVCGIIAQWKFALEKGVFPGRYADELSVDLPPWRVAGVEIDFGDDEEAE